MQAYFAVKCKHTMCIMLAFSLEACGSSMLAFWLYCSSGPSHAEGQWPETHPDPETVSVLAVMLMARTWPTLAALILRLLVLKPGPTTNMPEPWLTTDLNSPPPGGTVTCNSSSRTSRGEHACVRHTAPALATVVDMHGKCTATMSLTWQV